MSVTASSPAAAATAAAAQKPTRAFFKKPSQDEKNETLKEIEANMEKIRPRLVSHDVLGKRTIVYHSGCLAHIDTARMNKGVAGSTVR
jgi:hypothetical protein